MFGDNFKKYRTEKGLSQNDVAERLFVTRQCVSKWEKGITEPDLATLTRISELLGVSVDALVKDCDHPAEKPKSKNTTLFIANILIAVFFVIAFFIVWRFLPPAIPTHWSHEQITMHSGSEVMLFNLIVPVIFLAVDVAIFVSVKKTTDNRVIYISHGIIALFQVAYFVFMVVMYATYFKNVISLITCMCTDLLLCLSVAMHPRINKKNEILGVRTSATLRSSVIWRKANALACYLFSGVSLIILIVNMAVFFDYSYLCLLAYLVPAIAVIVYAKLLAKIIPAD